MRALTLLAFAATLACTAACSSKKDTPDWAKLPEAFQPATAELTFNKSGLERFNSMSPEAREAVVTQLSEQKGQFKGQAMMIAGAGISENLEEFKLGGYELTGKTEEVLYEITLDYTIYTSPEIGRAIPRNRPIEFRGTLVALEFQDLDKPRKLKLTIQADEVTQIK